MSKRIITINRMYGSGGHAIGKALAEELEIGFYDKELIEIAARDKNIPFGDLADVDEKRPGAWSFPVNHEIQISQEDCVIVGRCANHILQDRTLSVFIYAPFETRIKNVMERLDREEKAARKLVKRMDKERRSYYEFFTDEKWLDMGQYDLCIDSSRFTTEEIVKILKEAYER